MGLGCQTIMSAHEGTVGVERNDGKGTTFSFSLPILLADPAIVGAIAGEREQV